jgi:hypothetical protein
MRKILEIIGEVGGIGAFLYLTFQFFVKKSLETWFDKRLKKFEYKLNSLFNRVTKIHEKEFEVLPQAWAKLNILLDLICKFSTETPYIPELNQKNPSELEKFLSEHDLAEDAKQRICSAVDKKNQYFYENSKKAADACLDFQDYIAKNAIFLTSDIKDKFKEAEFTIRTVWAIIKNSQGCQESITKAYDIVTEKIPSIMKEIEKLVQKRLHFYEA